MHRSVRQTALFEGLLHRRSVREYAPDVLDKATVEALLEAAVHAPTAMHRETWSFVIIQDKAQLQRYSEQAKALLRSGSVMLDAHRPAEFKLLSDPAFNIFYDASTLIVICSGLPGDHFAEADCWLAAENLMLAADAAGLGTCCIGLALPALQQPEAKAALGIPADSAPVAAIIVGVPRTPGVQAPRQAPKVLSWRQ
jgi:nitroreductase